MAKRSKIKPKDPQVAAAERRAAAFAAVNLSPDASKLPANVDLEAERATRTNAERARRMDAFEALKEGMRDLPGAYDAARQLEMDIVISRGEHDRGPILERVDNDRGGDRTDAMVAAGKRVDAALARIGERDAWLLCQLIAPSVETRLMATSWRSVVAYVTGEENAHAQAAAVRSACANLAASYERTKQAA